LLGLRRFRKIQIDLWQGEASKFAANCLVLCEKGDLPKFEVDQLEHQHADSVVIRATLPAALPQDMSPISQLFDEIFATVDRSQLRHLVIDGAIQLCPSQPHESPIAKTAMATLRVWIVKSCPSHLSRVTFVATDTNGYNILQKYLFAEYPDELDDENL
jgi:hypothetical protein